MEPGLEFKKCVTVFNENPGFILNDFSFGKYTLCAYLYFGFRTLKENIEYWYK